MKKPFSNSKMLILGLPALGSATIIIGLMILNLIFGNHVPDKYTLLVCLIGIIFFIIGTCFSITRQEIPRIGLPPIKGILAVFISIVTVIVFIITGSIIVYLLLTI